MIMTVTNTTFDSTTPRIPESLYSSAPTSSSLGGGGSIFTLLRQLLAKTRLDVSQQQGDCAVMASRFANAVGQSEKSSWQEEAGKNRTLAIQSLIGAIVACVSLAITVSVFSSSKISEFRAESQTKSLKAMETHLDRIPDGVGQAGRGLPAPQNVTEVIAEARLSRAMTDYNIDSGDVGRLKADIRMAQTQISQAAQLLQNRLDLMGNRIGNGTVQVCKSTTDAILASQRGSQAEAKARDLAASTRLEVAHDMNETIRKSFDDTQQNLTRTTEAVVNSYRSWLDAMNAV